MLNNLANILQLPESCIVNTKLTKAFFKRNFDLTLSERKLLDDFSIVVTLDLIASIKTTNSNISSYSDDQMQYVEVLVIAVQTSNDQFEKSKIKIAELIQKYIPYPILLCVYCDKQFIFNTADKRINRNEANKRTVEKSYYSENIELNSTNEKQIAFLNSLSFTGLEKQNLKTLYDNYTSRIIALQAATEITGDFQIRKNEQSKQDVLLLEEIATLQSEIVSLQNLIKKETQLNIQIDINNRIQLKRKQITELQHKITN